MGYDAVIFDKDGVLLDSGDFKWADKIRVKTAEEHGKDISLEQARKLVKIDSMKQLDRFTKKTGLNTDEIIEMESRIAERKIEMMKTGEIGLCRHAKNVLESLNQKKAVASNAPRKATKFTLEHFSIGNYFSHIESPRLSSLDNYVSKKKPSPVMIRKTIKELEADNPVMVGDSEDDIEAAENAGIDSIHVDYNGYSDTNPTYEAEELDEVVDIIKS
ncbi:MAG: HAD family hydrolase [Nanohaloarchaea archaeon]|nr:HAD family hydrolase [Candidatus Nanohaloarchaea archaeon]